MDRQDICYSFLISEYHNMAESVSEFGVSELRDKSLEKSALTISLIVSEVYTKKTNARHPHD